MSWLWKKGIAGTFLSGVFALLPVLITLAVVVWVTNHVIVLLGPSSLVGSGLQKIGLQFVATEWVGYAIGIIIALFSIWLFGLLVKSKAKSLFSAVLEYPKRLPFVGSIYGTAQQVVQMLNKDDEDDENMKGMEVVYAGWGQKPKEDTSRRGDFGGLSPAAIAAINGGGCGGFLALSPQGTYNFDGEECRIIYVPTSPVPMSGACIFWPVSQIKVLPTMTPDQVMQIYLSLGVLATQAVPKEFICEEKA